MSEASFSCVTASVPDLVVYKRVNHLEFVVCESGGEFVREM